MPFEIKTVEDLDTFEQRIGSVGRSVDGPQVLSVADILALDIPEASMLIEGVLPSAGASLVVGPAKSGKTLVASQMGIAVASAASLFGKYCVLNPGPVLFVEKDDPAGEGSLKTILQRSS